MFEAAIRPQASCNNFRISEDIYGETQQYNCWLT